MADAALLMTFVAALGSGLMAGTFFAFSVFVMGALARLPPDQGVAAMQSINVVVINPAFLATFLGTGVICVVLVVTALAGRHEPQALWLLAGSLLYLVGTLGVTMFRNVPMNNALARLPADQQEAARYWPRYVATWTFWNHVRAAASLAALAAFILALR